MWVLALGLGIGNWKLVMDVIIGVGIGSVIVGCWVFGIGSECWVRELGVGVDV